MTKRDAVEKIAKLQRLVRGTTNANEAETARRRIAELSAKFGLSDSDLRTSDACAAYDDLVDQLDAVAKQLPAGLFDTASVAGQVVRTLKSASDGDKASRLRTVASIVRTAGWLIGGDPTVAKIKSALEEVLKKHNVTV